MVVVLNEITKTAVVSNGVREQNTARESELKKKCTFVPITISIILQYLF